jgi:uncharacterized membrane protein YdbT with pleckstrin-like domain
VPELTIQPSAKFLKAAWLLTGVVVMALEAVCLWLGAPVLLMLAPPLLLLWPAAHAVGRRFTRTVIAGDRLRYETGLTSKSTRTIQLSKIQDVRVDQSLKQRIFNVGDLSIETAGETSRLTIPMVDNPQSLADEIMNRAQRVAGA